MNLLWLCFVFPFCSFHGFRYLHVAFLTVHGEWCSKLHVHRARANNCWIRPWVLMYSSKHWNNALSLWDPQLRELIKGICSRSNPRWKTLTMAYELEEKVVSNGYLLAGRSWTLSSPTISTLNSVVAPLGLFSPSFHFTPFKYLSRKSRVIPPEITVKIPPSPST